MRRRFFRLMSSSARFARRKLQFGRLPFRFVFIHLPKTGGLTIQTTVRRGYPWHASLVIKNDDQYRSAAAASREWINSFDIIAGHFPAHLADRVDDPKLVITCVREPIDRTISLYYFLRSLPEEKVGTPLYRLLKTLSLLDFVTSSDPLVQPVVSNSQARQLAGLTADERSEDAVMELAMQRLSKIGRLLVTEHLDSDLPTVLATMGLPPNIEQRNRNGERIELDQISPDVRHEIEARTRVDRIIYDFALKRRSKDLAAGLRDVLADAPERPMNADRARPRAERIRFARGASARRLKAGARD